jgi:hypothetical protein
MTRTRAMKATLSSLRLRAVIVPSVIVPSFGTRDFVWYLVPIQAPK